MNKILPSVIFYFLQLSVFGQMQYKGLSVVAPSNEPDSSIWQNIKNTKANAISLMPYAYSRNGSDVIYNSQRQYWGESVDGTRQMIRDAHKNQLTVMLKPHLWLMPNTYTGQLNFNSQAEWKTWTESYLKYIFHFAELAEEEAVDMFCIATEMQSMWQEYPTGFIALIEGVKKRYNGKLTYAANWDEYKSFPFWSYFNYIGIDAYFPIDKNNINASFKEIRKELEAFSEQKNKAILFTEWGFRSINDPYTKPWESYSEESGDETTQAEAYTYFFESWQNSKHLAGVYIWKWFVDSYSGHRRTTGFTPQGKAAEKLLPKYFSIQ